MKWGMRVWVMLVLCLAFATIAAAQEAGVSGTVLDRNGKPWPGVTVTLKSEVGRTFTLKTDKDGKFTQIGLTPGLYTIVYTNPPELQGYTTQKQIGSGDNDLSVNFQKIVQEQGPNPEEQKKREEAQNAFKNMKAHVDAGVAALADADTLRTQAKTAPADQKQVLQDKMKTDYETAISELSQAEQGVGAKDVKNHAVVLSNLAIAQNLDGKYDDSVASYQKAIEFNPQPNYYVGMSQAIANSTTALTDPAAITAKVNDAGAACDKASALDPTPANTARCWKNIGIVLTNKGDLKDAVAPLLKSTTADPKDAQGWYLLGGAYTGMIDSKQEGNKLTYIIPPGTTDAYQKCIDADPNGPYAPQCKQSLDGLAAMAGGDATTVGERPKSSKKK